MLCCPVQIAAQDGCDHQRPEKSHKVKLHRRYMQHRFRALVGFLLQIDGFGVHLQGLGDGALDFRHNRLMRGKKNAHTAPPRKRRFL
jgi:hypothetical protein